MAQKLSVEVTGKFRSCLFLLAALFQQGPDVAARVLDLVQPTVRGGHEPPDFWPQIKAFGWMLKSALDALTSIDSRLFKERAERAVLLRRRNGLADKLGKVVVGLRRAILGYYVEPDMAGLGLEGDTAREPLALLRQGDLLEEQLQREDLEKVLGEPLLTPSPDPTVHLEQLRPALSELRVGFDAFNDSRRRVDVLLTEKEEAMQRYDELFLRVARQFEDLCRMAGKKKLADKVRPSRSRPGQTRVEPDDSEVPDSVDDVIDAADAEGASTPDGEQATEQTPAV